MKIQQSRASLHARCAVRGARRAEHAGGRRADMRARATPRRTCARVRTSTCAAPRRTCARARRRTSSANTSARLCEYKFREPPPRCWSRTRRIWGPPRSSARRCRAVCVLCGCAVVRAVVYKRNVERPKPSARKKVDSTRTSPVVTHPSTTRA